MSSPKTSDDCIVILHKILNEAGLDNIRITKITCLMNQHAERVKLETTTKIISALDSILQPDQIYPIMKVLNIDLSDLTDLIFKRMDNDQN